MLQNKMQKKLTKTEIQKGSHSITSNLFIYLFDI